MYTKRRAQRLGVLALEFNRTRLKFLALKPPKGPGS